MHLSTRWNKTNKVLENALKEWEILKDDILDLQQSIIEINEKIQEPKQSKFKCNECDFCSETKLKVKNHMQSDHTVEHIPQMDGNDTISEEELESVNDSLETEIAYEIFYNKKKCKAEFESEIEMLCIENCEHISRCQIWHKI